MAFTDAEKVKIRNYLGRGILNKQLDPRLESAMLAVTADEEARARVYLTRLGKVEVLINGDDDDSTSYGALDNLDFVEATGEVVFAGERQMESLRREGRSLIRKLSIMFHTAPMGDYFDTEPAPAGGVLMVG